MATLTCDVCRTTKASGRIFYQCSQCKRWLCSSCTYKGKTCQCCGRGYTNRA